MVDPVDIDTESIVQEFFFVTFFIFVSSIFPRLLLLLTKSLFFWNTFR